MSFSVSVAFSSVLVVSTVSLKVVIRRRWGRHIMCPRSTPFPDRFGGGAEATSMTSHSAFPGPPVSVAVLRAHGVLHGKQSRLSKCTEIAGSDESGTSEGNPCSKTPSQTRWPWVFTGVTAPFVVKSTRGRRRRPGSSLASLLPSWSNPREVRRRTHEFPSNLPVTMARLLRGEPVIATTPNSFQTAPGSSLASPLPS